jgi:putative transposase
MPGKNTRKLYLENGYYHVYNRGVEKRSIFHDPQDYAVFLSYLKEYLTPKGDKDLRLQLNATGISSAERNKIWHSLRRQNFSSEITLLAYCLMPNHFHLFLKQKTPKTMNQFMGSLCSSYSAYYNHKYDRVGTLYEGVYRALLVNSDSQFLHLSRYIHKQALSLQGEVLQEMQPCSYSEYLGKRKTNWVHPEDVLVHFSQTEPAFSYERFVKDWIDDEKNLAIILD